MHPPDDSAPLPVLVDDFCIGDWRVRPALHRLERSGEAARVTPKVMHVLCCLAAQPGLVLRRDDLLATVWHGTVVTDTVLSRAISELRKVFGDDAGDPHVIETIPTTGYRLVASVRREAASSVPSPSASPSPRPFVLRWIGWSVVAVLVLGGVGTLLNRQGSRAGSEAAWDLLRAVPLTTAPGREHEPAFSPDGTRVVYVAQGNLYIRHVREGEGEALQLTHDPAPEASPVWSPDGGVIAFARYEDDACAVYEVAALGGAERRLTSCDPTVGMALAWSPDGRTLVFPERVTVDSAAASRPPASLVAFDRQTLDRRVLTMPPEPSLGDSGPVFSPDGRRLAFIRRTDYWADDLYLLGLDEDTLRRVTFDARSISGVDWAEDGRGLVWGSNRGGAYSLWKIGLARGATPEPLYVTSGGVLNHPRLARQGRRLVYENWSYESNIWRTPARKASSTAPAALAIGSTMWDLQPAIAPDGQEIAFTSTRSGSFELWSSRLDGSDARQLTRFEGPFVGMPRWSADGRRLAFVARTGEAARDVVYVLNREASVPQALTEAQYNSSVPSWTHDGSALYVGSDRSGAWQVWRCPLDGRAPTQVTDDGGAIAFESPDGTTLYYNKIRQAAIWQRPVGGGPETLVVDEATLHFDWWNWVATDEGFYFFQPHDDGTTDVIFFDRTTRRVTPIATVEHLGFSPGIAVTPDEAWLFYTRADRSEGDLMLVEPFE